MGSLKDPPEMIPEFVKYWEQGYEVVAAKRVQQHNGLFVGLLRKFYYWVAEILSSNHLISGVMGVGLYDKRIIDIFKQIDDIQPSLSGLITEYTKKIKLIEEKQEKGNRCKTNTTVLMRYDMAMVLLTSNSKYLMRISIFSGIIIGILSILFGIFIIVMKLFIYNNYPIGIPSVIVLVNFLAAVQLFCMGVLGEYVLSISNRSIKRPLVVVDKKLNFEEEA
jgi:hypothetical protein